jgi:HSP20 family protein
MDRFEHGLRNTPRAAAADGAGASAAPPAAVRHTPSDLVEVEAALMEHARPWSTVHPVHHYTPHSHIYPSAADASAAVMRAGRLSVDVLAPHDDFMLPAAAGTSPASPPTAGSDSAATLSFRLDVAEDGERYIIHAELPGVDKSDIEVVVHAATLTIAAERRRSESADTLTLHRAERRHGALRRTLRLPPDVQSENADAVFANGLLTITMHKIRDCAPRKIPVR